LKSILEGGGWRSTRRRDRNDQRHTANKSLCCRTIYKLRYIKMAKRDTTNSELVERKDKLPSMVDEIAKTSKLRKVEE